MHTEGSAANLFSRSVQTESDWLSQMAREKKTFRVPSCQLLPVDRTCRRRWIVVTWGRQAQPGEYVHSSGTVSFLVSSCRQVRLVFAEFISFVCLLILSQIALTIIAEIRGRVGAAFPMPKWSTQRLFNDASVEIVFV